MPKRDAPPHPMIQRTASGLMPLTAYDGELLDAAPIGQMFDAVPRAKKRSDLQLRWYWGLLNKLVKETEAQDFWGTAEHLHDQLMRASGFVRPVLNPATGEWVEGRDSAALHAMTPEDFNAYLDRALLILSSALSFDVTEIYPPRKDMP